MNKPAMIVVTLLVVIPLAFVLLFKRVDPMSYGVKQLRFGGSGVVDEDYDPGFHVGISGLHRWYLLPRQTHFIHFIDAKGRESPTTMWTRPLEIRTHDNNQTTIEATIPYHIIKGKAYEIVKRGLRQSYPGRVRSTVENILRSELAELSSKDWQITATRLAKAEETLPILNEALAQFHVKANDLLIRRVAFPPEYEAKLQDKQYLTQKAELDKAETSVAEQEMATNSVEKQIVAAEAKLTADWDKKFQEEMSRFEVFIAEINALAKVYEAQVKSGADATMVQLQAEGQLSLDQAHALRDKLRNHALGTRGGSIFLALKAAENLSVPSVTLNSNDPRVPLIMDLDELTKVLLGTTGK